MDGVNMEGGGRFYVVWPLLWAYEPTARPPPKGPAEGGGRGEGFLGPYAHSRGFRDRTRPLYLASTHLALADNDLIK